MKICVAQTKPVTGNIEANINNHKQFIIHAVTYGADTIVFPELSITGYEPTLAKALATDKDDNRLDIFQELSNANRITIGIGMPLKSSNGIQIGMIIFQPHQSRLVYAKQHLHADEYPYFVNGEQQVYLLSDQLKIAIAICYELSVAEHAENVYRENADIYIASVAKTATGVEKATISLAGIASKYAMTVLMSNCIGLCDGVNCGGKSSVWNKKGELTGQLDDTSEGILLVDTNTMEVIEMII